MNKRYYLVILLLVNLFACQNVNAPDHHKFFNKILGEWTLDNRPVIEKWTYINKTYKASVMKISGSDKIITEEITILEKEDGVFYAASVKDQNNGEAVLFKLVKISENRAVFENLNHDFPKRITYEFVNENFIKATIEGESEGDKKSITFNYYRSQ
jgi:hypothetical protein